MGAVVSVLALALAFVVAPYVRRWHDREAMIDARASQVARMRQAIADTASTRSLLAQANEASRRWPQRVVAAPNREVAAAVLQAQLKEWADGAGVQLNRIEPDTAQEGDLAATMVMVADAPGLAGLLDGIATGRSATRVRALDVRVNPVLRGPSPLLNVTLVVAAPWRRE